MFLLPVQVGTEVDGISDDKPLKLDGIGAIDFIPLLKYLFRTKYVSQVYQKYILTIMHGGDLPTWTRHSTNGHQSSSLLRCGTWQM